MKKLILILAILLTIPIFSIFAQEMQDVVYLKNGDLYKGIIIENVPNDYIRIEVQGGSVFTINYSDIAKLSKEKSVINKYPINDFGLSIQPLGLLQFGPVLQGEFKIAPNFVLGPEIRFVGLGLASHAVSDYDKFDLVSMGVGLQAKYFFGTINSPDHFYLGLLLEYVWGGGEDEEESFYNQYSNEYYYDIPKYSFSQILFASNFGYRWRFPSGLFLSLGVITGVSDEITDERSYPSLKQYSLDLYFFGMVEFSLGLEL